MLIFATAWHLGEQTVTGQRCKSRTQGSVEKKKNPTISRLTPRGRGRGEEERVGGQETCQELEKST